MSARRRLTATLLCTSMLGGALAGAASASPTTGPPTVTRVSPVSVVVQAEDASTAAEAVRRLGGLVTRELPIIAGVAAEVGAGDLARLRSQPGISGVTQDYSLRPLGDTKTSSSTTSTTDTSAFNTMHNIGAITGAHTAYKTYGMTGRGIDVALIDTGVAPVQGLTSGNVINGPDLSFDSQEPSLQHSDAYGHGTHMAGLIVGRDVPETNPARYVDDSKFTGIAPDARLVNIKVGAADGAVDVSQVIAALNWVAEHGQKDGLNVRVVNLSYGTDSQQDYRVDPLAHAVEAAVRRGIVVVAAGGNDGSDKTYLGMPAQDPFTIAVGGQNPNGTLEVKDDTVPAFANRGDNKRNVDFVAPAVSVHGLRVPGSYIDESYPGARVGERLFKGSGTSQAAAIVSGAAALFLQKYPQATPDMVKYAFQVSAGSMTDGSSATRGFGALNVGRALGKLQNYKLNADPSTGTGSLELSRGSVHVVDQGLDSADEAHVLEGERDIFGDAFDSAIWAGRTTTGTTWQGGEWLGRTWSGDSWSGDSWTGRTWSGRTWSDGTWAGRTWSGRTWSGRTWSGRTWSDGTWDGRTWSGRTWSGRTWSGDSWAGGGWQ